MRNNIIQITRLIVTVLVLINGARAASGKTELPATWDTVYLIVSALAVALTFAYNTYKNFDVTKEGALGTKVTHALKAGAISATEVMALLEESEGVEYGSGPDDIDCC